MLLESVKMKNSKIGLRHVLSWIKPKGTKIPNVIKVGLLVASENRQTRFAFYKYRYWADP